MRIATIGECMLELSGPAEAPRFGFGGDTLNTAIYLARLGASVDYVTALGDDPYSSDMLNAWQQELVGTDTVLRLPGRQPGLYLIRTDDKGERKFFYWRDQAPARDLFDQLEAAKILRDLPEYDWLYLSGVSLSLYSREGRAVLNDILDRQRAQGGKVAFDSNYRPQRLAQPHVQAIDTTAAGDSFDAAYIAARMAGKPPLEAAQCGHRLAGEVIRHAGAIIPRQAMPKFDLEPTQ